MARNKGSIMGFVPQAIDANTVFGNLRVTLPNKIRAGERLLDVSLDTISDLTHCSAVPANSNWLSAIESQQSLCGPANFRSAAVSLSEQGARVWSNIATYIDRHGGSRTWLRCCEAFRYPVPKRRCSQTVRSAFPVRAAYPLAIPSGYCCSYAARPCIQRRTAAGF